jgi:hypothetical protein
MREPATKFSVTLQSLIAVTVLTTIGGPLQAEPPAKTPADGKTQVDPVNWKNEANQDVFVDEKVIRGGSHLLYIPKPKPAQKLEELTDKHYHYESLRSAARNTIPYDFDYNTITGMRVVLAPKIDIPIPTEPTYHTLAVRKKEIEQQKAQKKK